MIPKEVSDMRETTYIIGTKCRIKGWPKASDGIILSMWFKILLDDAISF